MQKLKLILLLAVLGVMGLGAAVLAEKAIDLKQRVEAKAARAKSGIDFWLTSGRNPSGALQCVQKASALKKRPIENHCMSVSSKGRV